MHLHGIGLCRETHREDKNSIHKFPGPLIKPIIVLAVNNLYSVCKVCWLYNL